MVVRALENFLEPSEVQKVPKNAPKQLFFQKNGRIIFVITPLQIVPNVKKQLEVTFEVLDHDWDTVQCPRLF